MQASEKGRVPAPAVRYKRREKEDFSVLAGAAPAQNRCSTRGSIPQIWGFVKGLVTNSFTIVITTLKIRRTGDRYVDTGDESWYDGAMLRQYTALRQSWSGAWYMRYKRRDLPARQA